MNSAPASWERCSIFSSDIIFIINNVKGVKNMFICSFKLNRARMLSGIATVCLALTLIFLIMPEQSEISGSNQTAANQQEMVDYLETLGYTVTPQAVLIESVMIPEVFDEEYTAYNELQKPAGFDLTKFSGVTVQKYTFKVLNYEDKSVEVVANLLVHEKQIVGGDISSTELGGFCNGLVTDKSNKENKNENIDSEQNKQSA